MAVQPGVVEIRAGLAAGQRQPAMDASTRSLPVFHLLVAEANTFTLHSCSELARDLGFLVYTAGSAAETRRLLRRHDFDLVLLDLKLEGGGLALVEEIRRGWPKISLVVSTAYATVSSAVEALRLGAVDYLTKPFAAEELATVLRSASERVQFDYESRMLRERIRAEAPTEGLTGKSPEMERLYRMLSKIVPATLPVLISGEPGTGKKRVARWIHTSGPNAHAPYLMIRCGDSAPATIEAELFGAAPAMEADGVVTRSGDLGCYGALGLAGTTIFLDRVDAMPLEVQGRLLRAMQERQFRPVGGTATIPLLARILAGSSRDLSALSAQGLFRRDLFQRLNVVHLHLPALRERRGDVALLANLFLEAAGRRRGRELRLSSAAMELLEQYEWPGNVAELETAMERAATLSSGDVLHVSDMTTQLENFRRARLESPVVVDARSTKLPPLSVGQSIGSRPEAQPTMSMAERERRAILTTLEQLQGDKLMTAKLLGIGRTTLYRKLKEYGIRAG